MSERKDSLSESVVISQKIIPYLKNLGFNHVSSDVELPSKGRIFRADLVVYESSNKIDPIIVAEVKSNLPVKLTWLDSPVQQAYTYATALGEQVRYLLVSDGTRHQWFEISRHDRSINLLLFPPRGSIKGLQKPLIELPLTPVLDPGQFLQLMRSVLDAILLDVRLPGIQAATELNRILIAKLYDEHLARSGNKLRFHSAMGNSELAIANVKRLFEEAMVYYGHQQSIRYHWRISSAAFVPAIQILEPYSLSGVSTSVVGTLFWRLFPDLLSKTRDENTTPFSLGEILVQLGRPEEGSKVIDPVCGTGLLLIETYRFLNEKVTSNDKYSEQQVEQSLEDIKQRIFGIEINQAMAELASSNMALNNLNPSNIYQANALDTNVLKEFFVKEGDYDLVLMDPPIGRFRYGEIQPWQFESFGKHKWVQYDAVFVELGIKLLQPGGRLVTLVPDNFLFASSLSRLETRKWLLENVDIKAIISLPPGALAPAGHQGKASILLLQKPTKFSQDNSDVLIADIQNVGYDERGKAQPNSTLPLLLEIFRAYMEDRNVLLPPPDSGLRIWTIPTEKLDANRLDVSALDPEKTTILSQIQHGQYPVKKLLSLVSISSGRNFKKYVQDEDAAAIFVQAGAVRELRLDTKDAPFISKEDFEKASRAAISAGDVLVTTTGQYLGRASVVPNDIDQAVASSAVTILRPNPDVQLDSHYLAVFLNSSMGKDQIEYLKASATAQPFIRRSDLGELLIPLPPIHIQREIANVSRKMLDQAHNLRFQAQQLEIRATESIVGQLLGVKSNE